VGVEEANGRSDVKLLAIELDHVVTMSVVVGEEIIPLTLSIQRRLYDLVGVHSERPHVRCLAKIVQ
jgi:hypothetical protein